MMKKFAFLLLFLLPLVSCVNRQGADQVESIKDSLTRVVAAKDSMINEVFASMNAVAENLNAIKVREKIINKNIDNGEIRNRLLRRSTRMSKRSTNCCCRTARRSPGCSSRPINSRKRISISRTWRS